MLLHICQFSLFLDATGSNVDIGGGVDHDEQQNINQTEPLPILGRCKSLYPFEGMSLAWFLKCKIWS